MYICFQCIYIYIYIYYVFKKEKMYICVCVCVEVWMSLSNMLKTANIHQPVSNMIDCSCFSNTSTFLAPKAPTDSGYPACGRVPPGLWSQPGMEVVSTGKKTANHIVVNFSGC